MKVAVVGCGAVGSFYGAKLCRAGHEVHFLLRSDYEVVRQRGVEIRSVDGDFCVRPVAARAPGEIGPADLVLIGLKTTANDQFPSLLPPLVGAHTGVLTLQNGLGNEEQLARLFSPDQILGGLCFVCLNRTAPGVIEHLAHGLIVLGEYQRPAQPRTHAIAEHFRRAGVPCQVTDNLAQAHWEKLVWNIPFNGLGVASAAGHDALLDPQPEEIRRRPLGPCLTTDRLLADPRWERLVRELMHEVIAIAAALGFSLSPDLAEKQIRRTREMGAYKASTLLDFELGRPLELESLFLLPLREARRAGVAAPRLSALCAVLEALAQSAPAR
ncbi:MAG: 2-dehydropantoate 2-reductase [Verrucomicrobiales bacterium]|nr:2-dehydropantoate 2-reductase [Verrucomicrobiales bacterium]